MSVQQYTPENDSLNISTRSFLLLWGKNPVLAIGNLHILCNQSDHSYGIDLYRFVHEHQTIDKAGLHEAIEAWFSLQFENPSCQRKNNAGNLYEVMMEIYHYASWNTKHNDLRKRITLHFEKHEAFINTRFGSFDSDKQADIREALFRCVT